MPMLKSPLPTERIIRAVFAVLSAFALMPVGSAAAPDTPANELPWFLKGETHSSNPPRQFTYTNRLVDSNDPYLLLHAHNPVDWYPWGREALARARRENKPIFVSVGYSTCYWCHVAERTIYSDPKIAELMNKWLCCRRKMGSRIHVGARLQSEDRPAHA